MGDASRLDCCHPAVATRSPSSAPCAHKKPARTHQQLVVARLLPSGNPARFRRTNSRGFHWGASSGHTSSTARKGRSLWRVPSLGPDRSLHPLNIRSGIQSSTVKLDGHGEVAGVGRGGHRPYIETKCCRLRKTTTRTKNGAQGAQTCHRIESVGLIVGRHRKPHDAQGCPCSKWGLDSSWTPVGTFLAGGGR